MRNVLLKSILPPLLAVLYFDWYYHFQCRSFYAKLYYLPFYLYHIITNTIIFYAGLDAKDLALHPEDKHLFRLAKLIKLAECYNLVIKLGLSDTAWDDIQYTDSTVKKFVALCKWKGLKYTQMSKPSFKELSDTLAEDYGTHFLCQVGNNCSHRWLFNCIIGSGVPIIGNID
jgi:hypothetical protein